jgi:nucleotide-binding universal stress UspA family protein
MAGVRAIVGAEQWREYQTVVGLEGFSSAHPMLDEKYRELLAARVRDAEAALAKIPGAAALARGPTVDLLHMPETAFAVFGFCYQLCLASVDADPVITELLIRQTLARGGGPIALIKDSLRVPAFTDSTVIVAWKPLAAAKRALESALPLLRVAKQVWVVSAGEYGEPAMEPGAEALAQYLTTCHQVRAEPHFIQPADSPVAELSQFYHRVGADLIVMGAYSHSRFQELLFGGFTQHLIEKRACNLYLAH